MGRALGLDRALEVKTIRRKFAELAADKTAEWVARPLPRRYPAKRARVLYADGARPCRLRDLRRTEDPRGAACFSRRRQRLQRAVGYRCISSRHKVSGSPYSWG